jgi:PAS domain S-box-containing protein
MALVRTNSSYLAAWLHSGGEMGRRISEHDWGATALGPINSWSGSLRAIVGFLVHSPIPIVMLWGQEGIMIYNDAYSIFAGDNHPRILGCKVREGWPEVADFNDNVMKVGLQGGTLVYKDHLLRLNRTGEFEDVWMNLDYSPTYDDEGKPAGVLAIVVETTALVESAKALRESEARLRFLDTLGKRTAASADADEILAITTRAVGEQMGVSICSYADMDGDQEGFTIRGDWWREGSASVVGRYKLSDFGTPAAERLRAGRPLVINDRSELSSDAVAIYQQLGIEATICVPLVKDQRLTALMAIHDRHPRNWSVNDLSMIREVTDRSWAHIERVALEAEVRSNAERLRELNETLEKRVNERSAALERSQTQFRLLVQGVTDYAIFMLDTEGHVSSWNAGAERIKGYAPHEIIGRHFSSFYTEEDLAAGEPSRALATARRDGTFVAEGWRQRKDGTCFRASVVIDAIHDDEGELIGFAKITRDVTAREEAQHELEVAREALFQSQKMEALGQLTGGISHDFNNLLAAIISGLELLRKRVSDDPQITLLIDTSIKAAERGTALTQRMLAFARRQELKAEPVRIPSLVADMTELLQRALGPNFVLETRLSGDLPSVSADLNQLEMALLNLVVNARDAMPGGGIIKIDARERHVRPGEISAMPAGSYVCLTVTDNGSGMDATTLARATEPFFTTKGTGKGTGLGLSMVHGYLHQLGGAFQIESELGSGTTAYAWLPVAGVEARQTTSLVDGDEEEEPVPSRRKILVIDDDGLILMNTVALLEDLGHVALDATSGREALALFEQHYDIDLLITDQIMPGMSGCEVVALILEQRPELPVILATGYGEIPPELEPKIIRLNKPFTQAALTRAINMAIRANNKAGN